MDRPQGRSRWYWWSAAIYLILLVSVVWGLISARRWALADLATPQSTAEWEAVAPMFAPNKTSRRPVRRAVPQKR